MISSETAGSNGPNYGEMERKAIIIAKYMEDSVVKSLDIIYY
jgi:hypothetical protein